MVEFLVLLAILIVCMHPWILIVAGILFVAALIWAAKSPSRGGGGGYSGTSYSAASYESAGESKGIPNESSEGDGYLYRGRYRHEYDTVVATYRNGHIFEGYNSGLQDFYTIQGTYQSGYVYRGSLTGYVGDVVGRYENGYIYLGNSTFYSDCVARYENGKIYKSKTTIYESDVCGTYTGDGEGAAAAAILYLLS